MDVNARGDRIDANGNVIDSKNRQIQRQVHRQTSAAATENFSSTQAVRQAQAAKSLTDIPKAPVAPTVADLIPGIDAVAAPAPVEATEATETTQGLAGALVRAKKNKQTPTEE
jgi:hypothetical protein